MESIEKNLNTPINHELNDFRREREILLQESIDNKNAFAENIKDILGEEIKAILSKKVEISEKKEKKSKIEFFLDKLSKICK